MIECLRATHDSKNCMGEITARATDATANEEEPLLVWECRWHMEQSRKRDEELRERYPDSDVPPAWFDPTIAGEEW